MELALALSIVQELLAPEYLNPAQEMVFKAAWEGKSYPEIAETAGYDQNYIRGIGAQIWRTLSTATGTRVSKNNFREIIELSAPILAVEAQGFKAQSVWAQPVLVPKSCANNISVFYGREGELKQLSRWLLTDRCRLVAVLGMGGMGKTAIALKLTQDLQAKIEDSKSGEQATAAPDQFSCILWRSLLNAPLLEELLPELIHTSIDLLGIQADTIGRHRPISVDDRESQGYPGSHTVSSQIDLLMEICQQHRCLIVFDNCESIFQSGAQVGQYRQGYANYGDLFSTLGRVNHQSCLLLTSREKPAELGEMEEVNTKVRTLILAGLDTTGGEKIFTDCGCSQIETSTWAEINSYSGGNPLILQLVAAAVKDIADGDATEILADLRAANLGFTDVQFLLEQQWERLTSDERQVMYWLAIRREPMALVDLVAALQPTGNQVGRLNQIGGSLLTILQSLCDRSTIEIISGEIRRWLLPPFLMEYVTNVLVAQLVTEIERQEPVLLDSHGLIRADSREYIRQTQLRLIVEPILYRLQSRIGCPMKIASHLRQILIEWRKSHPLQPGYLATNIFNLLTYLELDLTDLDCSELLVQPVESISLSGLRAH